MIEKCISRGYDVNNLSDQKNNITLLSMSFHGYNKCVNSLLQHGANPNMATSKNNITPLCIACYKGHNICVATLLQHGA